MNTGKMADDEPGALGDLGGREEYEGEQRDRDEIQKLRQRRFRYVPTFSVATSPRRQASIDSAVI